MRSAFSIVSALLLLGIPAVFCAQPSARAATASPAPALSTPSATPSPTPSEKAIVNSMNSNDLQQAIQILKSNYINPDALNETDLNRALLSGILQRLGTGVIIMPEHTNDSPAPACPFYGELLDGHVGYLRLGALTAPNLKSMDTSLQTFTSKKVDAIVVDLRDSPATNDFAVAADFAKRFVAKGKLLFTLRKPTAKQERTFLSEADPAYHGLLIVLSDRETAGPAEAIAGVLRFYTKALVIGEPSAGRAVEYSDLPLNGGRTLRVAVAEAVLPEAKQLFPGGIKPDIPVEMSPDDKRLIFQESLQRGMGPFVFENERPHLNEAALLSGRNPEIEAMEASQRRGRNSERPLPRDPVLQRAVDVVTSVSIYQQR
ncbi:MAG: S41 family peptidase [Chthoniobacterales bacterium]